MLVLVAGEKDGHAGELKSQNQGTESLTVGHLVSNLRTRSGKTQLRIGNNTV